MASAHEHFHRLRNSLVTYLRTNGVDDREISTLFRIWAMSLPAGVSTRGWEDGKGPMLSRAMTFQLSMRTQLVASGMFCFHVSIAFC
jgi:hypothetical protein